ncbi:peroxisomal and mitochondrial division factor 2 [Citrus sinensis]|uniref:peroxisomal and mitochondrial division factor 2-like n=1 Tax=Citrus sinensis TaxID=2711 RepID=UPI0003D6DEBB|nr:peroxisomal and mitochondrial division factor 2-like [Citrus sinensis]XP_015387658.1 peroxisomal and mitochondrial division factor 2-like [Citrus sinensis]XP_015387659.1 peroxisomal and mitochondrial division factor 2-like [Citrus sinensis]KAH9706249.1 peroxisomal and mitochondrial division factor 2 [Citrus sinensis]
MAESTAVAINGVDDQTTEDFFDPDQDGSNNKVTELTKKVESLELENKEMKGTIKKLTIEIEGSEEDKRILESVAARAEELEIEVSRLQHDLVTSMSEGDELGAEVAELKRVLGEKGVKLEELEREVDGLKKEKVESEKKVRELERNVGLLEVREMEEKSKRVRVEEEMREKLDEKDREISGFKKKVDDLESELGNCKSEKNSAEQTVKEMEERILLWQKEIEEAEKVIAGLKDKTLDGVNGTARAVKLNGDGEEEDSRLNWQLPLAAVTAAAVVCVCYARCR